MKNKNKNKNKNKMKKQKNKKIKNTKEVKKMKKQIEVVAAVIDHDGKILCMQRNDSKHEYIAFKWEFPGGKIEKGETHKQALARELKEEMNYEVAIYDLVLKVVHEYPDFVLTMHAYKCSATTNVFDLKEHINFKWLPIEQLNTVDWAGADIPIVEKLIQK